MPELDRIRASDAERDAAAARIQAAFAEGRIDDAEFDQRMRAALTARTRAGLAGLLADLPGEAPTPLPAVAGSRPGALAVTFKSAIRRSGRWRVPRRYTTVVYKGSGWFDLRAAELTAPVTTIWAVAYKSRVDILVPPGVRVEAGGLGVSTGGEDGQDTPLPAHGPVVHVRGLTYKGRIEVATRSPRQELPG